MGKIVAVWSDVKNAGKSVTTYILANQIREMGDKDLKILVCCLNFKYSTLYKLFGIDTRALGMEDLVNYQFFENGRTEKLESVLPRSNGINFLGTYRTTNAYAQRNMERFKEILIDLQNKFDLIIFDTVSGSENVITNLVLQKAHMVLKLFVQDNESMKELNNVQEEKTSYDQEKIYIISKYRNIYPRKADVKRRYSLKNVFTMEYCETLQEMKNRDSLHLYLQRETHCINSVRGVSKHILEYLGLNSSSDSVKESPRRYIRDLINNMFAL